jgi:diguanylate cyclase (GGDEF)-like protein
LARYGGEEFVVILTESNRENAMLFGERVRAAIASDQFRFGQKSHRVTVSVGVAATDGRTFCTPEDLLQQADEMMYASKRAGRNRVSG